MRRPLMLASALLLAALPAAARDRNEVPEATPAGKPVNCISIRQIRETRVRDDQTIDFVMNGRNRVYRNTLPQSCPRLGFEERFSYRTSQSQLCSTDIITVLQATAGLSPIGSCGLGKFAPVTLAKPAHAGH